MRSALRSQTSRPNVLEVTLHTVPHVIGMVLNLPEL